jgi:hypothetical protein
MNVGGKTVLAHRIAYELANGPIPDGLCVMHICDRKTCVNPEHLTLGSIADNNADMRQKGRHVRGERVGGVKLTAEKVQTIRELAKTGNYPQEQLAMMFGVSRSNIGMIVRNRTWSDN